MDGNDEVNITIAQSPALSKGTSEPVVHILDLFSHEGRIMRPLASKVSTYLIYNNNIMEANERLYSFEQRRSFSTGRL